MNHFYYRIPGWFGFHDVYDRAVSILGKDGAHFVEVGCYEGRSAAYMGVNIANSGKYIKFDCVDSWEEEIKQYDIDGRLTIAAGGTSVRPDLTLRHRGSEPCHLGVMRRSRTLHLDPVEVPRRGTSVRPDLTLRHRGAESCHLGVMRR